MWAEKKTPSLSFWFSCFRDALESRSREASSEKRLYSQDSFIQHNMHRNTQAPCVCHNHTCSVHLHTSCCGSNPSHTLSQGPCRRSL